MSNDTAAQGHPRNETHPDGVDLIETAGMAAGRSGLVDGAEFSLMLVLAPDPESPLTANGQRALWAVVTDAYQAGRIVGILQAQADAYGCRPGLDAAAEHGAMWARGQLGGDR